MKTKKLISGLTALLIAFLFVFVVKDFSSVEMVITLIASIFGFWGITDWRKQYDKAVAFFKSKTIIGAIMVALPMMLLSIFKFFGFVVPDYIIEMLKYLVQAGGGWLIFGASHAVAKYESK